MAPPDPSRREKLLMIPILLYAICAGLSSPIRRLLPGGRRPKRVRRDMYYTLTRVLLRHITTRQFQWISPSTEQAYLTLMERHKQQPDTVELPCKTAKLHWIGDRNSERVLLYFHGGGYALPATRGHVQWVWTLQDGLEKKGIKNFAIAILSYTLAPEGQYPQQFREGCDALQYLIETEGKKPSNIIIGGDSAGGNLTLSVLSHLLHPHPSIKTPALNDLSSPLAGAILVCPWTNFGTGEPSVWRNATADYVDPYTAKRWEKCFLGSSPPDPWNEPGESADEEWFKGLEHVTKRIFICGGSHELLIDSINVMAPKLQAVHPNVEFWIEEGAAHEEMIMDTGMSYFKEKPPGTVVITNWLEETLAR